MTQWHLKSKRKPSGGVRTSRRRCDKKKSWKGRDAAATKLTKEKEEKKKKIKGRGRTEKIKLKEALHAQTVIKGKSEKIPLTNVILNDADRHFARRLIVTKGAIIEGLQGKEKIWLKVTNRPGQTGVVQAKPLTEEEKLAVEKRLEKKKKTGKKEEPTEKKEEKEREKAVLEEEKTWKEAEEKAEPMEEKPELVAEKSGEEAQKTAEKEEK